MTGPTIFLCYRRSDTPEEAQRLYDRLTYEFGEGTVFFDQSSIRVGGTRWKERIASLLESSVRVLVALIGPGWLQPNPRTQRPRIRDRYDYVRFEIATAFGAGVEVIPVRFPGADIPSIEQLPEDIRVIRERHAVTITASNLVEWNLQAPVLIEAIRLALSKSDEGNPKAESSSQVNEHHLNFRDNLNPDETDVYEAIAALRQGRRITIQWPDDTVMLFDKQHLLRPQLRARLIADGYSGQSLAGAIEQFDEHLRTADFFFFGATARIPLMWQAMKWYGDLVDYTFQHALRNFLAFCNLRILTALWPVQLASDARPLPEGITPRESKWPNVVQTAGFRAVFDSDQAFWAVEVATGVTPSFYIYGPKSAVESAYERAFVGKLMGESLVHDYLIPQVEMRLMGAKDLAAYDNKHLSLIKVRDHTFAEV